MDNINTNSNLEQTEQNRHWRNDRKLVFTVKELIGSYPDKDKGYGAVIEYDDGVGLKGEFTAACSDLLNMGTLNKILINNGLIFGKNEVALAHSSIRCKLDEFFHLGKNISYRHQTLGWTDIEQVDGKSIFLYKENPINGIKSFCNRNGFDFGKGSEKAYRDCLEKYVIPNITTSLGYTLGFAAVVASKMKKITAVDVLIVNLCGLSSTGKSTIEQLCVSIFTSPTPNRGTFRTANATANAMLATMDGIHGLPLVIDDLATNKAVDYMSMIYNLATGTTRERILSNGKPQSSGKGFSGIVLISSEMPLTDLSVHESGVDARVINTDDVEWTKNAEAADAIKKTVEANYGFMGGKFVEFLNENFDEATLEKDYRKYSAEVYDMMTEKDGLSPRIANGLGIILLTITLVKSCFGYESWDEKAMIKILVDCEQRALRKRNKPDEASQVVRGFIARYEARFTEEIYKKNAAGSYVRQAEAQKKSTTWYGLIKRYEDEYDEIYIIPGEVDRLLKQSGYTQIGAIKKAWAKDGTILVDNDGRLTKKLRGENMICFKIIK